ncbi:MAG: acetoacetate--CoA ligase [Hyphomicrobiales bacterium]|nr:MAG: acetoacetate--CoA ligase [Hyphomicrobiales bacterium]
MTTLWTPSEEFIAASNLTEFSRLASERSGTQITDYQSLHAWSVSDRAAFWDLVWDYCDVIGDKGARKLIDGDLMPAPGVDGARFFPDAQLNYAENVLRGSGNGDAMVFWGEDKVKTRISHDELTAMVSKIQQHLTSLGVTRGDRVAAMMPNMIETIATMLAATGLGAVWSSCSPDFGVQGVLDRFGQIEPKVLLSVDGYWYNGKRIDIADKLKEIVPQLPSLKQAVIVDYLGGAQKLADSIEGAITLDSVLAKRDAGDVEFVRTGFSDPLCILFSSGTTGIPKCIVHSVGGTLLQHMKEHRLQCDIRDGDRVFYFTTCGWMMWNWLVTGLASNATLLLFDGSPFAGEGSVLFDYADAEDMSFFGTSAKFIDALKKSGLSPRTSHKLSKLRSVSSTGSPLAPESFEFVYSDIKADVHLASISGGTDIVSCFVLGVPTRPVIKGEIQGAGLGMAIEVWNDDGKAVHSEKGELVCVKPFPCMPISFWNDDGSKYHAAYFERFDNIWCHGDFAEHTAHDGFIIHGRSDATLNPGGVRIGTAEIYNQVEQLDEIAESICVGQDHDDDVRVVLFVRLATGVVLDDDLIKKIRTKVRTGASPRHVPAKVIAVSDIPRTKSGKIVELAVRNVVHGREVKNKEALANPEALELYRDLPELQ